MKSRYTFLLTNLPYQNIIVDFFNKKQIRLKLLNNIQEEIENIDELIIVLDFLNKEILDILSKAVIYRKHLIIFLKNNSNDFLSFYPHLNLSINYFNELDNNTLKKILLMTRKYLSIYKEKYQKIDKEISYNIVYSHIIKDIIMGKKIASLKEEYNLSISEVSYIDNLINELEIDDNALFLDYFKIYLPFIYKTSEKRLLKENQKLSFCINDLTYMLEEIYAYYKVNSFEDDVNSFLNKEDNNYFYKLLIKINALTIKDDKIFYNLSKDSIQGIIKYIDYVLNLKSLKTNKVFFNYSKDNNLTKILRIFNNLLNLQSCSSLHKADLIIHYISFDELKDERFLNNIKLTINNKKHLFIYLNKCKLNLYTEYLIKYFTDMYAYTYKRYDYLLKKYKFLIEKVLEDELVNNVNVIKLK